MADSIVLFGATGYTGRLVAAELVARGARPVLAGRDPVRLTQLAEELDADLEVAPADARRARSIADLLGPGDVLVSTVGPFVRYGPAAAVAAVSREATYLDSTGEGPFVQDLRVRLGERARAAGVALVPAFGYDYVPGNLAGALALGRAGDEVARLDVGYFTPGSGAASGGTTASAVGIALMPSFRFARGRLVDDRTGARTRTFRVEDRDWVGVAVGGTEHLFLPEVAPSLLEVGVYLGAFGPAGRYAPALAAAVRAVSSVPGVTSRLSSRAARLRGSTGGPDQAARAAGSSLVVAEALAASGELLSRVELVGPNGYDLTARLLAWGAVAAAAGQVRGTGVLGPVQAFGLDELVAGCAALGLVEPADG